MPLSGSLCRVPWNDGLKMVQTRITNEWIVSRFDEIYPIYRIAFARLLVTLRRDFDGDLDAMVVLLTLSLGTDREGWAQALLGNHVTSNQKGVTNTQSIALASGIPRETVRRKLDAMEMRGWISRDEKGNWAPTPDASKDLRASSQETISFIRTIAAAAISADPDRPQDLPSTE
jgi:hypothetical protein